MKESRLSDVEKQKYVSVGMDALRNGKVALVILAGGQSTRMGTDIVKGTIDIGLPSGIIFNPNSRFRQIDLPAELRSRAASEAALSRRDSHSNSDHDVASQPHGNHRLYPCAFRARSFTPLFKSHHFFGLCEEDVTFFSQSVFPCLDQKGRIIMRSRTNVPPTPPHSLPDRREPQRIGWRVRGAAEPA